MAVVCNTLPAVFAQLAERFGNGYDANADYNGFQFELSVADDYDADPADGDEYTPADIAAFWTNKPGGWKFVGIKLMVTIDSLEVDASAWGVEYGLNREASVAHVRDNLLPDLFDEIRSEVASAAEKFAALLATDSATV